jgi:DNA-directed RNA polymerase sigma subunit (sigma70/sigma32)
MSSDDNGDKKKKSKKTPKNDGIESSKIILKGLTAQEAKVLRLRFGIDLDENSSNEEIMKQFEVTRERIGKIEARALKKLRNRDNDEPDDDEPVPA